MKPEQKRPVERLSPLLHNMQKVAYAAAKATMRIYRSQNFRVEHKTNPRDTVTAADLAAEKIILEFLKKNHPDDAVIAEESGDHGQLKTAERVWLVDPVDGTNNFIQHNGLFGIMICEAANPFRNNAHYRGNEGISIDRAVVFAPEWDMMLCAEKGRGTFINGKRVRVDASGRSLEETKFMTGFSGLLPSPEGAQDVERLQSYLQSIGKKWVSPKATAMAQLYLLTNRTQAYANNDTKVWDFAPLQLTMQEAGYEVRRFNGDPINWFSPTGGFLIADKNMHHTIRRALEGGQSASHDADHHADHDD